MKTILYFLILFLPFFAVFAEDFPISTISAQGEVAINEQFLISVSGEDNNKIEHLCLKEENDDDWSCFNGCKEIICSYDFPITINQLGRYKFFGYTVGGSGNSFSLPEYLEINVVSAPLIEAVSVKNYDGNSAILEGYVKNFGGSDFLEVWFEYGTESDGSNYLETEKMYLNSNNSPYFQIKVEDLTIENNYYFRATAKNAAAKTYGSIIKVNELLKNNHFQTGSFFGWQKSEFGDYLISDTNPIKGNYFADFGFVNQSGYSRSSLRQEIKIPENAASVVFSASYIFNSYDYCDFDNFRIRILNSKEEILETFVDWCCSEQICRNKNYKEEYGWNIIKKDLGDYLGQNVIISFEVWRKDSDRKSWISLDDVSVIYKLALPPEAETKEIEIFQSGNALLEGGLINTGGADWVKVWFVWDESSHNDWKNYQNKTEIIYKHEEGLFSNLIGNLSSNKTYNFRAIAENNAGIFVGENKSFTTLYTASGGWVLPDYHIDVENRWSWETLAYDDDTTSRAMNNGYNNISLTDWRGFLEFHLESPILSNKLRVSGTGAGTGMGQSISRIFIKYKDQDEWIEIFNGILPENHRYVEISYEEDFIEAGKIIRRHSLSPLGDPIVSTLGEFQFYEVPNEPMTIPTGATLNATKIEFNSAILKAEIVDDGRDPVIGRFVYWKELNPENLFYTEWDEGVTGASNGWAAGSTFGRRVTGLENHTVYYYKAQFKNSMTVDNNYSEGGIKIFLTRPADIGWVSPTVSSGGWIYKHYGMDDIKETFTSTVRMFGSPNWSDWLEFERDSIFSDKIRFMMPNAIGGEQQIITDIEVAVKINGVYQTVFLGSNFNRGVWTEVDISDYSKIMGSWLPVTGARVRLSMISGGYYPFEFDEFEFYKLPDYPKVEIKNGISRYIDEEIKVEIEGFLEYMGGESEVLVWAEWRLDDAIDYKEQDKTEKIKFNRVQEFTKNIGNSFLSGKNYYFRLGAENSVGTFYSDELLIKMPGCVIGTTADCLSYISDSGAQCIYRVTCQESGEYARCEDGYCALDSCCNCEDLGIIEGYTIEGIATCGEYCICDYSLCEYVLVGEIIMSIKDFTQCGYNYPDFLFSWETKEINQHRFEIRFFDKNNNIIFQDTGEKSQNIRLYDHFNFDENHRWELRIEDEFGNWTNWHAVNFQTPYRFITPKFSYNVEQVNLQKIFFFSDESLIYVGEDDETHRSWDLGEGAIPERFIQGYGNNFKEVEVEYFVPGMKNIVLTVTDSENRSCTYSEIIQVNIDGDPSFWDWREVYPF